MAMTLADIRSKYPQYKDVPDQTLADKLYDKYYAHADRREFDARIGLNPYDNALEVAGKAAVGAPAQIMQGVSGVGEMLAEGEAGNQNAVYDKLGPKFKLADLPRGGVDTGNYARWATSKLKAEGMAAPTPADIEAFSQRPNIRESYAEYLRNLGPNSPEMTGDPNAPQYLGTSPTRVATAELKGKLERQQYDKFIPEIDAKPGSAEELAGNVVGSIAQMAPGYAASIALRNPAPAVALAQVLTSGQSYAQARDAGVEPGRAAEYALQSGFAEAVGEALPLGIILKEGGGKLLPKLFKAGTSEALQEGVTQFIQSMLESGTINPDMTWEDVKKQVGTAMATGAVAGGVLTGAVAAVDALGRKKPTAEDVSAEVLKPAEAVIADEPIENQMALPAPDTLLALPSPEMFAPPPINRRQPQLSPDEGGIAEAAPERDETDYLARVALQRSRQTETKELLQTARETISPLGTFSVAEVGGPAAQRVNQRRIQLGRPLDAPITIEELASAKVPQAQIDAVIAARRPATSTDPLTALDITRAAEAKNIVGNDGNFGELAYRTTGTRDPMRMTQTQLRAFKAVLDTLPVHDKLVTVPIADQPAYTEDQYGKALDAVRNAGRYTPKAIKDATGLKNSKDVVALRDAMVRRGQLVQRSPNDFRLYDVLGEERQTTPDDVPNGAFKDYVVRRIPVSKVRVRQNGKAVGVFGSASEARSKVSAIRASEKDARSEVAIEPAEETAWGVLENRYDEQGNLLGQVIVDSSRDEAAMRRAADQMSRPDTGPQYTQTTVEAPPKVDSEPVRRAPAPEAVAGRTDEILKRLNKLAAERKLPLLGVRVKLGRSLATPDGRPIEGMYLNRLIRLSMANITSDMTDDQIVDRLAQVMDHELIHALREAGVLGPETDGWKTIMRYARRAKRPGASETYFEWARRNYAGERGYENPDTIEEEAIAEAFRHWAANKRNVPGKPGTVFSQLVEWFKRLFRSVPDDLFEAIETGRMVEDALRPPGAEAPRARATRAMQSAQQDVAAAQAAGDENAVRTYSRAFLRARAQAREDRYGRSGPKTVLGTTPSKTFETAPIMDRAAVAGIVDQFRQQNGVSRGRLMTYLPEDVGYLARVADAQQRAAHDPTNNAVAKAYRALIDETRAMWNALGPIEVTAWAENGAPYASPADMLNDVLAERLKLRLSADMFGPGADNPGHPLNNVSGVKTVDGLDLTHNDLLRVVHDIYGHGQSGFRDDPRGQYNAYHEHARLLSPEAARALATETLAQGSWANYGPHLRRKDGTVPRVSDVDYLPPAQKEFAEQKAFLLSPDLLAADPGWALAEKADSVEDLPKFSLPDSRIERDVRPSEIGKGYGNYITYTDTSTGAYLQVVERTGAARDVSVISFEVPEEQRGKGIGRALFGYVLKQHPSLMGQVSSKAAAKIAYDAGRRPRGEPDATLDDVLRKIEEDSSVNLLTNVSKFDENLPGGRLYGNPNRSPGGALSKPGTPSPALTNPRPGNQYFGGELAEHQLQMARTGDRGAALVYLSPDDFLALANVAPRTPLRDIVRDIDTGGLTRLTREQHRAINRAVDTGDWEIADLPISRLVATQAEVNSDFATVPSKQPADGDKRYPLVIRVNGVNYIRDGHHRVAAASAGPTVRVRFIDTGATPVDARQLAMNVNPEQEVYNAAIDAGYKFSGYPSLVLDGYAGNVRAVQADGAFAARALTGKSGPIPVVLYPKRAEGLGLITALEGPDGTRVAFPHEGFQEFDPSVRGPRYSVGSPEFQRWFGESKVVDENGAPLVVYRGDFPNKTSFRDPGGNRISGNVFFSSDPKIGRDYVRNDLRSRGDRYMIDPATLGETEGLYRAYLALETPLVIDAGGNGWNEVPAPQEIKDEWGDPDKTIQIDELAQWARERGHDGLIVRNVMDQHGDGDQFVAFEPTQIKSAIANNGQYDIANPDIRYSLNAPMGERVPSDPPNGVFNILQQRTDGAVGRFINSLGRSKRSVLGLPSIFDARVKLQDKMLSIKEMIEDIKQNGGSITDLNDTYMLEQLYHGKVFEQIREREETLQLPLLEALKAAHDGPNKITPKEFEDYLYARHAPERNAYLRTRGAVAENPSGMSDAEAGAILDKFALDGKMPEMMALEALARRITANTTATRIEGGLISPDTESPYQHYVPLRGFAEEDLDPDQPTENQTRARSGKGFSVGGREDRSVTGRTRKAGDLLGHLFLQNTEAVIRAEKNQVALSFLRLLQENPQAGYGQILKTAPTRLVAGANGMIHAAGDPSYRQAPDIVTAKFKGQEIIARVVDPRLARAIKSDYVTTSNDLVNFITRWAGMLNRYLATINTAWNPEFLISNLARDAQTAGILSQQYDIPQLGRKILGNAPKAMAGIREVLRDGTAESDWARTFLEMQKAGGTTEFLGIHDLETQVRGVRRSVTQTGLNVTARKAFEYIGKVGKFVGDYNKVAENAFRLSAYRAARESGATIPQAAYLAKNLTVNFNKGGELKGFMNAMYLFYNASTQGTAVLLNGLKSKRVQKIVAGVVVMGVVQDLINRAISGDEDDNGVKDYDDIPDYILETNFVLMDPMGLLKSVGIDKGYIAIPMPYGFNAFYNLGRNMSAGFSGSPVRNPASSAVDSAMTFVSAFNPIGGVQSVWNFIAPTIADPAVDLITNKDFAGNDIVPERPSFGLPVPNSQKYWSNTGAIPKDTAALLNSMTGGNEVRPGAVDISPEQLQYAFDYAFGSMGKFALRIGKLATETGPQALQGDFADIEIGDIPFARRVVGSIGSRGATERYYQVAQEVKYAAAEMKLAEEDGNIAMARQTIANHPVEVRLIDAFDDAEKSLQDLRKQLRDLRENENIPAPRKREIEKRIKDAQDRLMAQMTKLYFTQKGAAANRP